MRELMEHKRRIQSVLNENISDMIQAKEEYQADVLLYAKKHQLYCWIQECSELTEEMVGEIIDRVDVGLDSVMVAVKYDQSVIIGE